MLPQLLLASSLFSGQYYTDSTDKVHYCFVEWTPGIVEVLDICERKKQPTPPSTTVDTPRIDGGAHGRRDRLRPSDYGYEPTYTRLYEGQLTEEDYPAIAKLYNDELCRIVRLQPDNLDPSGSANAAFSYDFYWWLRQEKEITNYDDMDTFRMFFVDEYPGIKTPEQC